MTSVIVLVVGFSYIQKARPTRTRKRDIPFQTMPEDKIELDVIVAILPGYIKSL